MAKFGFDQSAARWGVVTLLYVAGGVKYLPFVKKKKRYLAGGLIPGTSPRLGIYRKGARSMVLAYDMHCREYTA